MSVKANPWTHVCCATSATALLVGGAANGASADHHVLQPGETLSAVARRYHISIRDLQTVNHLKNVDNVADYTRLVIPPPPPHVKVDPLLHVFTRVKGNSVSLRLGPDSTFRRVAYLNADDAILVTARRGDWAQVKTDSGDIGWLRSDYLQGHSNANSGLSAHAETGISHFHHAANADHVHHRAQGIAMTRPSARARHEHVTVEAPGSHMHRHRAEVAETRHHAKIASGQHNAHHRHEIALTAHEETFSHRARRHRRVTGPEPAGGGADIVRSAIAYRGTPYVYGGAGRGGFDCSGFTSFLYSKRGVALPHSARAQFEIGRHVGRGNMRPGDLVFFHTVTPGISHVGMYVGNGRFVHASSRRSGGVRVDSLSGGYYSKAFRGATHIGHR